MKKIIIILDGLADYGKKTSLEVAKTPNLDFLAKNGKTGLMYPIKKIAPESGESQFVLLGYPLNKYPGRGILEALGSKIKPKKNYIYLRANFAKRKGNKIINRRAPTPNKKTLAKINKINKDIKLIPTIDYRAILEVKNASPNIQNTHPGYKKIKNYSIAVSRKDVKISCKGDKKTSTKINSFIKEVEKILKNKTLLLRGASNKLPKVKKLKNWNLIADMPIEIGLGKLLGMNILKRSNEIKQIINSRKNIYVQIKGPDTFGHKGDKKGKIKTIEKIDKKLKLLTKLKNTLICITSDHATPYQLKRHSHHPVPILIYGKNKDSVKKFTENACKKGSLGTIKGKNLMKILK